MLGRGAPEENRRGNGIDQRDFAERVARKL